MDISHDCLKTLEAIKPLLNKTDVNYKKIMKHLNHLKSTNENWLIYSLTNYLKGFNDALCESSRYTSLLKITFIITTYFAISSSFSFSFFLKNGYKL
jgi:uncharacterized protein YqiB (DUF1249 family)